MFSENHVYSNVDDEQCSKMAQDILLSVPLVSGIERSSWRDPLPE